MPWNQFNTGSSFKLSATRCVPTLDQPASFSQTLTHLMVLLVSLVFSVEHVLFLVLFRVDALQILMLLLVHFRLSAVFLVAVDSTSTQPVNLEHNVSSVNPSILHHVALFRHLASECHVPVCHHRGTSSCHGPLGIFHHVPWCNQRHVAC